MGATALITHYAFRIPHYFFSMPWFVLRDLKRPNSKLLSHTILAERGFEVFTPLKWVVRETRGHKERRQLPVIADLLFVNTTRDRLDPEIEASATLQYRYIRGAVATPLTVRDADMERFIRAVNGSPDTRYYLPSEISPDMYGRTIRIVGGPLDGYEGNLLRMRGSAKKRLLVHLPGFLTAAVEVSPDYIQLL